MKQFSNFASLIRSRLCLFLVALLIAGILAKLIIFGFDVRQLSAMQSHCRLLPWAAIALLIYIIGFALRGLRLKWLVQSESQLTILTATNIVVIGHAANNILPARLGEIVQAGMLKERTGFGLAQSLTTVCIERFFDGMSIILLLLAVSMFVPLTGWMLQWSQCCAIICLLGTIVIVIAATIPQWLLSVTSLMAFRTMPQIHNRSVTVTSQILRAFAVFRHFSGLLRILGVSLCIWFAESLFFAAVMNCFALPVFLPVAVTVMSLTNLSIFFSASPAYLGTYHSSSTNVLLALLSDKSHVLLASSSAMAYSFLIHLIFFATTTTWGLIALTCYTMRAGNTVLYELETAPLLALPPESQTPGRVLSSVQQKEGQFFKSSCFWTALAESLVGAEYVERLGQERMPVLSDVSAFVVDTLSALPTLLRLQLSAGLFAFQLWVLLTKARTFSSMILHQRSLVVDAWAEGQIPLTRKLFRPLRSLVLLSFFEDHRVQALCSDRKEGILNTGGID